MDQWAVEYGDQATFICVGCAGTFEIPSATENLPENTDGGERGSAHPTSALSGRQPTTF